MPLPDGVLTATVRIEPAVTYAGQRVAIRASITPTHTIVHEATGKTLGKFVEKQRGDGGITFVLPQDQPGFVDEDGMSFRGWGYVARVEMLSDGDSRHIRKAFMIAEGTTDMDLLKVLDGTGATPVSSLPSIVTSIDGRSGAINLGELIGAGIDAQIAAGRVRAVDTITDDDRDGVATVSYSDGTTSSFSIPPPVTSVAGVIHGADATYPRPDAFIVHWYGSVSPTNAQPRDEWIQE